jgi:Extracellular link domain
MFHPLLFLIGGFSVLLFFILMLIGFGITSIFYIVFFFCLVIYIIINALLYFFEIDVVTNVTTYYDSATNTEYININENSVPPPAANNSTVKQIFQIQDQPFDSSSNEGVPIPEIKVAEQVFNIPANTYTYQDAKAVCSAYGARLASYNEIEDAYKKGGEWCNYGWSENQMILFPTQQKTYDQLQQIKGHENDCGRQGINGGYIANPNARFGVNCFGYKPEMTTLEEQMMENATSPYPLNAEDLVLQKKIDFYKKHLNDILISPFNSEYWSKIF